MSFVNIIYNTELQSLLKKSIIIIIILYAGMFIISEILRRPISAIFVGYDKNLLATTEQGFIIYSFSYLFMGMAIFGSSFFTALNNGPVSARDIKLSDRIYKCSCGYSEDRDIHAARNMILLANKNTCGTQEIFNHAFGEDVRRFQPLRLERGLVELGSSRLYRRE